MSFDSDPLLLKKMCCNSPPEQPRQPSREFNRRRRRGAKESIIIRELEHLLIRDLGQLLAAVTDIDTP